MASEAPGRLRLTRALLTVSDTSGLEGFARLLTRFRTELLATAGTRRHLASAGISATSVEELTGVDRWFGGRVKTLHPALLGPILAPATPQGRVELSERGLKPIDLVVVNFYPFARRLAESPRGSALEEEIDIGGVTLARAAAKNHAAVAVATDPGDYPALAGDLESTGGFVEGSTRRRLARQAFARCADYDRLIASAIDPSASPSADGFPPELGLSREPLALRYGENPHQAAAAYRLDRATGDSLTPWPVELLKGQSLSYTNLLDLETALATVAEFPTPSAAVVKHATPCGVASGETVTEALGQAFATDPVARYGCTVAVNRPFEGDSPGALSGVFVDLLAAPSVRPDALEGLQKRTKLKVVRADPPVLGHRRWELRSALGRVLVQEADQRELAPADFRCVTTQTATPLQAGALDFAWRVVRHAKSNAIVLAQGSSTVGIGSGQATRVTAVELAVNVAGGRARGSVLASDAFFPFADGVEAAGKAGVAAIVQPGGSVRDAEVIAAAERFKIAMYFTGWRVFRH